MPRDASNFNRNSPLLGLVGRGGCGKCSPTSSELSRILSRPMTRFIEPTSCRQSMSRVNYCYTLCPLFPSLSKLQPPPFSSTFIISYPIHGFPLLGPAIYHHSYYHLVYYCTWCGPTGYSHVHYPSLLQWLPGIAGPLDPLNDPITFTAQSYVHNFKPIKPQPEHYLTG